MGKKKNNAGLFGEVGIPEEILMDPAALDAYLLQMQSDHKRSPAMSSSNYDSVSDGDYSRRHPKPSISATVDKVINPSKSQSSVPAFQGTERPATTKKPGSSQEEPRKFAPIQHNINAKLMTHTAYGPYLFTGARLATGFNYPISLSKTLPEFAQDSAFSEQSLHDIIVSFYTINKIMSEPDAVVDVRSTEYSSVIEELEFADNDEIIAFVHPRNENIIQFYILDFDYVSDTYVRDVIAAVSSVRGNIIDTIVNAVSKSFPNPFWVADQALDHKNAQLQLNNFINVIHRGDFKDPTIDEAQDVSEFIHEPASLIEYLIHSIQATVAASYEMHLSDDDEDEEDYDTSEDDVESKFDPFTNVENSSEIGGAQNDNTPFLVQQQGSTNSGGVDTDNGIASKEKTNNSDTSVGKQRRDNGSGIGTSLGPLISGLDIKFDEPDQSSSSTGDISQPEKVEEKEKKEEPGAGINGPGQANTSGEEVKEESTNKSVEAQMVIPVRIVGDNKGDK